MRIRIPTPIPRVPGAPIFADNALPQNPPTKTPMIVRVFWSREATFWRNFSRPVSDMSSIQIVVNGTMMGILVRCRKKSSSQNDALVVPKCVSNRLPCTPWRPRLRLMKASPTNDRAFVQDGSSLLAATLDWPLFQIAMAAAIVSNAWTKVVAICHIRFAAPTLSPIRPKNTPRLKAIKEHRACLSELRKLGS
jgi:hypothetical protein